MPAITFIHRLLLAVLLLSAWTVSALPARAGSDAMWIAAHDGTRHTTGDVLEQKHRQPHEAVLSGVGYVSAAASLQSGHTGGAGDGFSGYTALSALCPPHTDCSGLQLRRWQLLAGAVHHAQLHAHYPAHGFW
jgi:hypothetical protein